MDLLMHIIPRLVASARSKSSREIQSLVRASGLFDDDWYRAKYPDIDWARTNPLDHYLRYGFREGRDPGPQFSTSWYISTYKDVAAAGENPLLHFITSGRSEGHQPQPEFIQRFLSTSPRASSGEMKIFCIGLNKTGTTSLEQILKDFGYRVGDQAEAEMLMDCWTMRDFDPIVNYCRSADAFQDVPFSLDFTYEILDQAFPGSKFILTVRNSAEDWYRSLVHFHSRLLGLDHIPTVTELKAYSYHYQGYIWEQQQNIFAATEKTLYNELLYKQYYNNHNLQIIEYFKFRPSSLLVLNLANPSAMESLCRFLGINYTGQNMPHLNKGETSQTGHSL